MLIVEYQSDRGVVIGPPLSRVSECQGILAVQSAASFILYKSVACIVVECKAVGKLTFYNRCIDESRYRSLFVTALVH